MRAMYIFYLELIQERGHEGKRYRSHPDLAVGLIPWDLVFRAYISPFLYTYLLAYIHTFRQTRTEMHAGHNGDGKEGNDDQRRETEYHHLFGSMLFGGP